MREYEGPVYNNGARKPNERRFDKPSRRRESGKYKFEPAYSEKTHIEPEPHSEEIQSTELELTEQVKEESPKQVPTKSGLANYEIPFLKKQNKSLAELRQESEAQFEDIPVENELFEDQLDHQPTEEEIQPPSRTERMTYEPAFTQTGNAKGEEPIEKKPFRPTELPKPYKKPDTINQRVDENSRLLAKRLQKSRDSFLLFDN